MPVKDILRVLIITGQTGPWATQLARAVEADRDASVVGLVSHGQAVEHVGRDRPDIVGLDMSGLSSRSQAAGLVREILALAPVPILVMVPSDQRRDTSMAAVVAGAVDVMTYPAKWDVAVEAELRKRLHALGHLSQRRRDRLRRPVIRELRPAVAGGRPHRVDGVVGLAASTGGPPALARVLPAWLGSTVPSSSSSICSRASWTGSSAGCAGSPRFRSILPLTAPSSGPGWSWWHRRGSTPSCGAVTGCRCSTSP